MKRGNCNQNKVDIMKSMRKAINEKCKECIYDPMPGNGTWRQQVEACTSKSCPLYEFRPKSEGKSSQNDENEVKD